MILNKYEVPECVAKEAKWCMNNYYYYKLISNKKYNYKETNETSITVYNVNGEKSKLYPAKIIDAVDFGIMQAVNEAPVNSRKRIHIALRNSIIDRLPRYYLNISKDTLYKYRKKAIYYVSVNLELLNVR